MTKDTFADVGKIIARSIGLKPLVEYSIDWPQSEVSFLSSVARGIIQFVAPTTTNAWERLKDLESKHKEILFDAAMVPASCFIDGFLSLFILIDNTELENIISSKINLNLVVNTIYTLSRPSKEPQKND